MRVSMRMRWLAVCAMTPLMATASFAAKSERLNGPIVGHDAEARTMVVKNAKGNLSVEYSPQCVFVVQRPGKMEELQSGDRVVVYGKFSEDGTGIAARRIEKLVRKQSDRITKTDCLGALSIQDGAFSVAAKGKTIKVVVAGKTGVTIRESATAEDLKPGALVTMMVAEESGKKKTDKVVIRP